MGGRSPRAGGEKNCGSKEATTCGKRKHAMDETASLIFPVETTALFIWDCSGLRQNSSVREAHHRSRS